jgi:uncharacterized membrane protein YdbT with pleckstrin-like domain
MAEAVQNYANHVRRDPLFHFFALPVFGVGLLAVIVRLIHHPQWHTAWLVVFLAAAVVAVLKSRLYALKVQDRIIRLEERLRLATLLPAPLRSRIGELSEEQLVGLRFASDAECAALAERALNEKLSRADIKKAVQNWRPDTWRV